MICGFSFCFKQKIEVSDNKKVLQMMKDASEDPENAVKRRSIISLIDSGTDLDILEIDDFSPKGYLGSGISSDVCLLVRKKDGKKFAGKFIKDNVSTRNFLDEATILKSCSTDCSTIINLIGITTAPKCLVLGYYVNGSLDIALREDTFNLKTGKETEFPFLRRLGYISDLSKAVNYLHRKNICHRDIAMRNLLLSDDKEHAILTDFSLSRVVGCALGTQSTFTAILPTKSAPETVRKSKYSTARSKNCERYYSLKADIWSLGVVMYEIVDKELGDISDRKDLPSGFSKKSKPSPTVFNRIQDLWILILRCWSESPKKRPQSWDLQERIEALIEDPLNLNHQTEDYVTSISSKGITNVASIYENQKLASLYSPSRLHASCTLMNTMFLDEHELTCGSLRLDSPTSLRLGPTSLHSGEQENPGTIMPLMMEDFLKKYNVNAKRRDIRMQAKGARGQSNNNQKRLNEESSGRSGYLLLPSGKPRLNPKNLQKVNLAWQRSKTDPSIRDSHLHVGRSQLALDSMSSLINTSCSSLYEDSSTSDIVQYCPPLTASVKSAATDMRYCKDRVFFKSRAQNLIEEEKPDTPESPNFQKSESIDEIV